MIFISAAFGSVNAAGVLGFNVFICESGDYDGISEGSAVISVRCSPDELEAGNLVLYSTDPMDSSAPLAMGYFSEAKLSDGIYYLSLSSGGETAVISESALVGRAESSSPFLGAFITFTKSPWGIFVMAVIPCAVLVLFDLLHKAETRDDDGEAAQAPVPAGEQPAADFSEPAANSADERQRVTADSVLFTHGAKSEAEFGVHEDGTLTDSAYPLYDDPSDKSEAETDFTALTGGEETEAAPPKKEKQKRTDAFFAQSDTPKVNSRLAGKQSKKSGKAIIDLEDALASASHAAQAEDEAETEYDVDDILAGLEKRRRK